MAKLYQVGEFKHPHRRRFLKAVGLVFLLFFITAGVLIFKDIQANRGIDESDNQAIVKTILPPATKRIDEASFTMEVPGRWKRVERSTDGQHMVYLDNRDKARKLDVYVNSAPPGVAVNRLMPLVATGDRVIFGKHSGPCFEFTETDWKGGPLTVSPSKPARWESIDFMCDFNKVTNVTGTGSVEDGMMVRVRGKKTNNTYLFIYTDHVPTEDSTIFTKILESFRAK